MSDQKQPTITPSLSRSATPSEDGNLNSRGNPDDKLPNDLAPPTATALATRENERVEAVLGDAILRFLRIRKGPKREEYDLDAVWKNPRHTIMNDV